MTRAEKMIAFIETLRTPDGAGVGQPFVLRGWQKAIIREVYDAEDGEGRRVVRLSMSRKNGKTALVAGLCLAHLCGPEAVRNGQLYSLAHDREQASVLFKLMTAMIYMDEELSERLNVVESRKRLNSRPCPARRGANTASRHPSSCSTSWRSLARTASCTM